MRRIEVDDDVFECLSRHAVPFDDTPNTVLRRLLGVAVGKLDKEPNEVEKDKATGIHSISPVALPRVAPRFDPSRPDALAAKILSREFGNGFSKVPSYKTMYQKEGRLVYFQNFNKAGSRNLWYRLHGSAWQFLTSQAKESFVCFTNPAENFAYVVPVPDILAALEKAGELSESIEVNIYVANNRWKWRQLDWRLDEYIREY